MECGSTLDPKPPMPSRSGRLFMNRAAKRLMVSEAAESPWTYSSLAIISPARAIVLILED